MQTLTQPTYSPHRLSDDELERWYRANENDLVDRYPRLEEAKRLYGASSGWFMQGVYDEVFSSRLRD